MITYPIRDKIPQIFTEKVKNISVFSKIILFGSTVEKKDRLDSDIDIAVIGEKSQLPKKIKDRIADIVTDIILEYNVFINWIYLSEDEINNPSIPIVKSIINEGEIVWVKERT